MRPSLIAKKMKIRNRNVINVLRDVQLSGVAPNMASVVTWDNTRNPCSEHVLEVTEPVSEPTWVTVIPYSHHPEPEEECSTSLMEGERKSKRINERKQRAIDEDSVASEDLQPLDLAVSSANTQCPMPRAGGHVLENSGPKKKSMASTQGSAPTLQAALRRANEGNAALKEKVKNLEEKVRFLEDDKQFLRQRLSDALVMRKAAFRRNRKSPTSTSDDSKDEGSSCEGEDGTDDSESSSHKWKKREKRKKKRLWNSAKTDDGSETVTERKKKKMKRKMAKNSDTSSDTDDQPLRKKKMKDFMKKKVLKPEDAVSRYVRVLKAVSRGMSKSDAYSYVGVNRKTIVDTTPIAELKEVDPETYSQLRAVFHKGKKGHTLYDFAKQCRTVLLRKPDLKIKVEQMKEDGRLLDIHTRD